MSEMVAQEQFEPDFAVVLRPSAPDRAAVVEVRGELDSGTCDELFETVRTALAGKPAKLTLDLRQMTFIDSAGTRTLILIERLADERGVPLVVTQPPERVTELLRTSGLADRVDLDATAAPSAAPPGDFVELELPRAPHSPARARLELRECFEGHVESELANVVLLTSELVTNAVVHPRGVGKTPVSLRVTMYEGPPRVRVEVEDSGEGFDRIVPVMPMGERGRGLFIVDRFSDRWGSGRVQTAAGPRFRVWFEVDWAQQGAEAATG
jgi:anti-anti-sigma factor